MLLFTQLLSLFVKTLFSAPVYSLLLLLHHGNTKCFQEICIFRVFASFCCINSVDYLELSLKSGEKSLFLCEWNGHLDCVTIHLKLWLSKSGLLLLNWRLNGLIYGATMFVTIKQVRPKTGAPPLHFLLSPSGHSRKTLAMEIFLSKKSGIRPPHPSELWTCVASRGFDIKMSLFLPIKT